MSGGRGLVATVPWLLLVAATLTSFALTEDAPAARLATTAVILIAAVKVRLVVIHFMEVPWSARPWRLILEAWIAAVTLVILGGYWLSPA
jgi:hypothetical protein